jgi:alkylresorcinol/alkylpyrone synthase
MTAILGIGTALPPVTIGQEAVRDLFASQPGLDRLGVRLVRAAFDHSAIETRHTVVADFDGVPTGFLDPQTGVIQRPTTGQRNELYAREAPGLFAAAARDALARSGVAAADVTHVVTASCTGFFAPGPDYRLVRDLGLRPTVQRDHLGFMGCAAAFPALRLAARICAGDPDAVVLVVCAELCTIHLTASSDTDQILSSAVFADGAAAAVVSARPSEEQPTLDLEDFTTALTAAGESDMQWTIGDHGFEMTLTAEVPRIIEREARDALMPALAAADGVDRWVVHPGGRSILDRFEDALDLAPDALDDSRAVLRDYGNMSSATVLFILQRVLADPSLADGDRVLGVAFGPGLTIEAAQLRARVPVAAEGAQSVTEPAVVGSAL